MFKKICPECKGEGKFGNATGTDWVDCEQCSGEGTLNNENKIIIGTLGKGKSFHVVNETN